MPFSLFLSVAANESVLPGGANAGMTFSSSSNNLAGDTVYIEKCTQPLHKVDISHDCISNLCFATLPCHNEPCTVMDHVPASLTVVAKYRVRYTEKAGQVKKHFAVLFWVATKAKG